MINPEIQKLFQSELKSGESLKWSEAPDPSRLFTKGIPFFLFGIPFTAFAIFWTAMACKGTIGGPHHTLAFFPFFGLPFLLIGLWMLFSPLRMARNARYTGYFITSQRAMIIERKFFGGFDIRSFYPAQLGKLERVQLANGSGDIILDREIQGGGNNNANVKIIGFFGVPDVRSVESRLTSLGQKDQ